MEKSAGCRVLDRILARGDDAVEAACRIVSNCANAPADVLGKIKVGFDTGLPIGYEQSTETTLARYEQRGDDGGAAGIVKRTPG